MDRGHRGSHKTWCGFPHPGFHVSTCPAGSILGERAALEGGGLRMASVVATTPVRVAVTEAQELDPRSLHEVARHHRREEG
jgi:hypothetical protein